MSKEFVTACQVTPLKQLLHILHKKYSSNNLTTFIRTLHGMSSRNNYHYEHNMKNDNNDNALEIETEEQQQSMSTTRLMTQLLLSSSPHYSDNVNNKQPNHTNISTEQQNNFTTSQICATTRDIVAQQWLSPPRQPNNSSIYNNSQINNNSLSCDYNNNSTQKMNLFTHHHNLKKIHQIQFQHRESNTQFPEHSASSIASDYQQSQQQHHHQSNNAVGDGNDNDDSFARLIQIMLERQDESKNYMIQKSDESTSTNNKSHHCHEYERLYKTIPQQGQQQDGVISTMITPKELQKGSLKRSLLFEPTTAEDDSNRVTLFPDNYITKTKAFDSGIRKNNNKKQRITSTPGPARRILSHPEYRDFANTATTKELLIGEKIGMKESFPVVLHEVLENDKYYHIIHWNDHGRSFVIVNKDLFTKEILPKYFYSMKQYASFHRQLNSYGFLRINKVGSLDRYSFYHEMFIKGHAQLAFHLPRARQNCNRVRVSLDTNTEPDFTKYPPVTTTMTATTANNTGTKKKVSCVENKLKNKNSVDVSSTLRNLQEDKSMIVNIGGNNNSVSIEQKQVQIINESIKSSSTKRQQQKICSNVVKKNSKQKFTTPTDNNNSNRKSFDNSDQQEQHNLEKCIETIIPKKIINKMSSTTNKYNQLKNLMNKKFTPHNDTESIVSSSDDNTINSDMIEFLHDVDL